MSKGQIIKIALSLLVICAVTSALVAGVYAMTYDAIQESSARAKQEAVGGIFPSCDTIEQVEGAFPNSVNAVFAAKENGELIGYAVDIVTSGFGGNINMMVGFDAEMSIAGVVVIEQSETPGLGANIKEQSFLDRFEGISGKVNIGSNVDALAGATISSKAVAYGINEAADVVANLEAVK